MAKVMTDGESKPERWIVNIEDGDNGTTDQEELNETDLGEVVGKVQGTTKEPPPTRKRGTFSRKAKNTKDTKNQKDQTAPTVSPETKQVVVAITSRKGSKTTKKQHQELDFDIPAAVDTSASATDESTATEVHENKRSAAAIAREERSKRRQAHFDALTEADRPSKKAKQSKTNEKVLRIPMLTGTLALHRGTSRRAEFIRKF